MPTLLATRKMSPELRQRIEASVSGRRAGGVGRLSPRWMMVLRGGTLATVLALTCWILASHKAADRKLESARQDLLGRWRREASGMSASDKALVERVAPWVEEATAGYQGDWIGSELEASSALAVTLKRPIVYLRGPLEVLKTPSGMREVAVSSGADALVLCLIDPPEDRTERQLLGRVRSAYGRGKRMQVASAHVERLGVAVLGLPYLSDGWAQKVREASDARELSRLRASFESAPLKRARAAARAELLLLAVDEPGDVSVPAELDGERPHSVRISLVDLRSHKLLLRLRHAVDPSWLSAGTRAEYARGMDDCALALDVHGAAVSGR